jgi:hypothetical protein
MIKASTTGVLTATVAMAISLAAVFVISSPLDASAHVVGAEERASQRIQNAFDAVSQAGMDTGFTGARAAVDCKTAVWPHIDASCLVNADASTSSTIRVVY